MNTLSESEIWRIIEDMDWFNNSKKYRGYYDMKEIFMQKHSAVVAVQVRQFVSQVRSVLYKTVGAYESTNGGLGNYGGDDSFGDLLDHAIGLGEKFYNAMLDQPELLGRLDYVENFCYSIPYEDDYNK